MLHICYFVDTRTKSDKRAFNETDDFKNKVVFVYHKEALFNLLNALNKNQEFYLWIHIENITKVDIDAYANVLENEYSVDIKPAFITRGAEKIIDGTKIWNSNIINKSKDYIKSNINPTVTSQLSSNHLNDPVINLFDDLITLDKRLDFIRTDLGQHKIKKIIYAQIKDHEIQEVYAPRLHQDLVSISIPFKIKTGRYKSLNIIRNPEQNSSVTISEIYDKLNEKIRKQNTYSSSIYGNITEGDQYFAFLTDYKDENKIHQNSKLKKSISSNQGIPFYDKLIATYEKINISSTNTFEAYWKQTIGISIKYELKTILYNREFEKLPLVKASKHIDLLETFFKKDGLDEFNGISIFYRLDNMEYYEAFTHNNLVKESLRINNSGDLLIEGYTYQNGVKHSILNDLACFCVDCEVKFFTDDGYSSWDKNNYIAFQDLQNHLLRDTFQPKKSITVNAANVKEIFSIPEVIVSSVLKKLYNKCYGNNMENENNFLVQFHILRLRHYLKSMIMANKTQALRERKTCIYISIETILKFLTHNPL